jgi:hypothetical protein
MHNSNRVTTEIYPYKVDNKGPVGAMAVPRPIFGFQGIFSVFAIYQTIYYTISNMKNIRTYCVNAIQIPSPISLAKPYIPASFVFFPKSNIDYNLTQLHIYEFLKSCFENKNIRSILFSGRL